MTDSNGSISPDQMDWVRRLAQIRANKKLLDYQEKEAIAAIKGFLGGRRVLSFKSAAVLRVSQFAQRRLDVQGVRDAYPDIAKEFEITSMVTQFRVEEGVL